MKDNDTLRNLLIAGAVFVIVIFVGQKFMPTPPAPPPGGSAEKGATPDGPVRSVPASPTPSGDPLDGSGTNLLTQGENDARMHGFSIVEAEGPQTRTIGSQEFSENGNTAAASPYRMRLVLSNVGAAIESATITDHAESLGSDERYKLLAPIEQDDGSRFRSLTIGKINIDGVDLPLDRVNWHVGDVTESAEGQRVDFWIDVLHDNAPALRITRSYILPREEEESGRHDLIAEVSMENRSTDAREVILTYRGGVGVRQTPAARMDDRFVDWGINDGTRVVGKRLTFGAIAKKNEITSLFAPSPEQPNALLSWAATANTYFTCTIAPRATDGGSKPVRLARVDAIDLDGSPATDNDMTLRFVTGVQDLAPTNSVSYVCDVYLGEKDGRAFRDVPFYAERNYYYQIAQSFGMCTFTWLVEMMIWLLNGIYFLTHDFGIAIIVLVLIVRTMLHPITKKGQVNMVRMQQKMGEFQPKIEELKQKYGNDKARMQQEQMKLYREHGINPAGQILNCLPMVLQMPIWVALFFSLSNNILMRHQPFHFTWIHDLTGMDALYTFATPIIVPLFGWKIVSFNLLPMLVAVFMYTQQKLQPKPKPNPNATDQQRQQQEMMQKMGPMMSIMMLLIFYNMPSGLNLYIMCSSLFGTIEQVYIRKHIKKHEEAGTLHKPAKKRASEDLTSKKRNKPGFFEKLQKMADEAQKSKASSQRSGKKKVRR